MVNCSSMRIAAVISVLTLLCTSPARAQSDDFYRGKTIAHELAVPDGTSWGLYVRNFVKHFRNHIPGNPNIIVRARPGGGGVAAANFMFNVASKDGTVIGTPLSTTMVFAATDPKEVLFDPRRFNWIGSLAAIQDVISVWHTAPAKTLDEARRTELVMGSTGKGTNSFQDLALANNLLNTKFKPVRGYKGGADVNIAIERGEIHGRATTWDSWLPHADWLRDRKLIHIAQLGPQKLPEIGMDVPLLREVVAPGEPRAIVDFIGLSLALGRAVYAPPDVPTERVSTLRQAFLATMKDPAYIADAKQLALDVTTWQSGEAIERVVREAFSLPPDVITKAKAAIDLP